MRRHLAAVAVLSTLLLASGCSGGDDSPAASGATGAPAPAAGGSAAPAGPGAAKAAAPDPAVAASADAALSDDTEAICAQAARTSTDFGKKFIEDLKLQLEAAGQGAEAKSRAKTQVGRDVQNYSYALADMAKL